MKTQKPETQIILVHDDPIADEPETATAGNGSTPSLEATEVSTPGRGFASLIRRVRETADANSQADHTQRQQAVREAEAMLAPHLADVPGIVAELDRYAQEYAPLFTELEQLPWSRLKAHSLTGRVAQRITYLVGEIRVCLSYGNLVANIQQGAKAISQRIIRPDHVVFDSNETRRRAQWVVDDVNNLRSFIPTLKQWHDEMIERLGELIDRCSRIEGFGELVSLPRPEAAPTDAQVPTDPSATHAAV